MTTLSTRTTAKSRKTRTGDRYLSCPLCGFEFAPLDTLCEHGCPLRSACGLVRCPMCDYEFPETPRTVAWLRSWFRRSRSGSWPWKRRASGASGRRGNPPDDHPGNHLVTVRDLVSGERVEVVHLGDDTPDRSNALAVFGLAPGSEITLVQRRPSYVVQVGETLLALDGEVAGSIVVRRAVGSGAENGRERESGDASASGGHSPEGSEPGSSTSFPGVPPTSGGASTGSSVSS